MVLDYAAVSSFPETKTYENISLALLEAVPAAGWTFAGWSGDVTGTSNPVTLTVDCAKSVTALFTPAGGAYVVYIPHVTGPEYGWIDYLQADNLSSSSASYTLTLYGEGGTEIYSGVQTVPALSKTALQLKSVDAAAANALAGKITYDEAKLNFRLSQQYTPGGGVTQFQLTDTLSSSLGFFFSDFLETLDTKGLALTNFGTTTAEVTLEAIGNGAVNGSISVSIAPNEKFINTYANLFNLAASDVQVIRATSTSATLAGVVVTSESDLGFLLFTVAAPIAE